METATFPSLTLKEEAEIVPFAGIFKKNPPSGSGSFALILIRSSPVTRGRCMAFRFGEDSKNSDGDWGGRTHSFVHNLYISYLFSSAPAVTPASEEVGACPGRRYAPEG